MIAANCKIPGLRPGSGDAAAVGAAGWLSFAATPTFGIMALLTGVFGRAPDMLCSAEHDGGSPLAGMGAMYVLEWAPCTSWNGRHVRLGMGAMYVLEWAPCTS